MKRTGWVVMGADSDIHPVEIKLDDGDDEQSYSEAKEQVLIQLRDHVAPYLNQINRLESDEFALTRKLPEFKAWRNYRRNAVVIAKTKKRACDIACKTRYSFDLDWRECDGDWWYDLAAEEGLWIEEIDEKKVGTGIFYHPLSGEAKEQIAEESAAQFRSMDIFELLGKVGQRTSVTGEHKSGTPYRIDVRFEIYSFEPDKVAVEIVVDDHLGWGCSERKTIYRDIPFEPKINWTEDGF